MVGADEGNLGAKVFLVWGSLCAVCFFYSYFLVYETKGLTLEQVDKMMEESTPLHSSKWKPHSTFAAEMGLTEKGLAAIDEVHQRHSSGGSHLDETSQTTKETV